MDARARLVIGGMTTVAASVAVVCTVALTNSVALAESPGSSIASARVLVPAASPAADSASPDPVVAESAPQAAAQPEVVEAPAPIVVEGTESVGADDSAAVADPPAPPAPPAPETPASADAAVEASVKAGTWDAVRSWALAHGWSQERIAEWITRLEQERAAADPDRPGQDDDPKPAAPDAGLVPPSAPAPAPERPANAGSTDRTDSSDSHRGGAKKDRSRDSPDRRDR